MKIFALLFFFPLSLPLAAQNNQLNQRYPGYFINAKNDTIRGYILLINKIENQDHGEYSNDSRGEKIKIPLFPDEVKGYKVLDRVYTSVIYGEPDPVPQHFLLTLAEGDLNLYQFYKISADLYIGSGSGQRPATGNDEQYLQSEFIIMNKKGKQFVIGSQGSLTKNAEEIFKGDHSFTEKIEEKVKGFRFIDLTEIVKLYNESVKNSE